MSANPHANGGLLLRDLRAARLPRLRASRSPRPATTVQRGDPGPRARGCATSSATTRRTFRLFGPDETASNRLDAVFEVDRPGLDGARSVPTDEHLAPTGRVMEVLSEHLCQGWLEGYLLTGRHGLFNCYEAFIHVIDSMFNQHAKWLKMTREIPLAAAHRLAQLPAHEPRLAPGPQRLQPPGPGLHRPRRQQEGRGHPGLPAARRELPAVGRGPLPAQPELRQRHRRRQAAGARLPVDGRGGPPLHARASASGTGRATTTATPDVVHGLLRRHPDARDARRGRPPPRAPARPAGPGRQRRRPDAARRRDGASARPDRRASSTRCSRPTGRSIFAYHGYPWLIHRLTYRRTNHANLHVRGYKEEGTVTTPFDMVMRNDLDRFHLVIDVIDRVPGLGSHAAVAAPAPGRRAPAGRAPTPASTARTPPEIRDWTLAGLNGDGAAVRVLVLNAGSATLKASRARPPDRAPVVRADVDWADRRDGRRRVARRRSARSCEVGRSAPIDAVGYRVVHGGERFTGTDAPRRRRRRRDRGAGRPRAAPQPARRSRPSAPRRRRCPDVPHVAAFDTAFHATLPEAARRYPVPGRLGAERGIRRYGFHGLSVAWSVQRAAELLGRPVDGPAARRRPPRRRLLRHRGRSAAGRSTPRWA